MISFSSSLIKWHKKYGRKNLPWQKDKSPYKVWISEIMLQQTQVNTASKYYINFISRYPTIKVLSESTEDEILSYWAGLGYYSRAKNIYKSVKIIMQKFQGQLPNNIEKLQSLPGIGRSTAGAIMALGFEKSFPILDANVKRILARHKAIEGNLLNSKNDKKLWITAESLLPQKNISIYTQALMDLGATICLQKKPKCHICPIHINCIAKKENLVTLIPFKKSKKVKPTKEVFWLIITNHDGDFLLSKRPDTGIWPGLWSFLEYKSFKETSIASKKLFNLTVKKNNKIRPIKNEFSHYSMQATPINLNLKIGHKKLNEKFIWLNAKNINSRGLPSPIKKTIVKLSQNEPNNFLQKI